MRACVSIKDASFKIPLNGTTGRYKSFTRHGTTLGSLANGKMGGSYESVPGNNLHELLQNVKNRYNAENDVVL